LSNNVLPLAERRLAKVGLKVEVGETYTIRPVIDISKRDD
jgi:hypothetical protein